MVSGLSDFSQQIHRIVGTYAEQEFGACIPELHSTDETKSRVFWAGSLLWARSGAWGFVPVSGAIRKPPSKGLSVTVKWASGQGQVIELAELSKRVEKVIPGILSCSLDKLVRGFRQGSQAEALLCSEDGQQLPMLLTWDHLPSGKFRLGKSINGQNPKYMEDGQSVDDFLQGTTAAWRPWAIADTRSFELCSKWVSVRR